MLAPTATRSGLRTCDLSVTMRVKVGFRHFGRTNFEHIRISPREVYHDDIDYIRPTVRIKQRNAYWTGLPDIVLAAIERCVDATPRYVYQRDKLPFYDAARTAIRLAIKRGGIERPHVIYTLACHRFRQEVGL